MFTSSSRDTHEQVPSPLDIRTLPAFGVIKSPSSFVGNSIFVFKASPTALASAALPSIDKVGSISADPPGSPAGIVNLSLAFCLSPRFSTTASVPGNPVRVSTTTIVAASPGGPTGPGIPPPIVVSVQVSSVPGSDDVSVSALQILSL